MPPKQQSKADLAKKQKVVEDKTFGLKNKNKSKNVQKYVQSLKQSVQPKPDPSKLNAQKKKEEEKAREKELNELFKVAIKQPKVPVGVDPKSILCEHFKKTNVKQWRTGTLEKVVASKSNEYNKNKPTDIVCKYFLEAVEKKQYAQQKNFYNSYDSRVVYAMDDEKEEASLAAQRAERAKNDRMRHVHFCEYLNGRELFLSDASLFVDDAEAYDKYQREEEPDSDQKVTKDPPTDRPGSSTSTTHDAEGIPDDDDDDDLDIDELNELEASLSRTTLQIKESGDSV
ncbi:Zinc finger CCCH domain-containing protein 11 [Sesamum angolense]|uniref:Zinc finger CCCH domain-containing protein 11 n=1 Tax=Sesamum angolense TaxID=2727404 RepID=A0AAE1WF51_9LAMI|nr:Zinc finger CCCH domain-containing protein 11 [Sesamum angolense]